jgi:hypothetical protein
VGFYSPCTSTHSGLLCLTPMIDEDAFWRIGGMKIVRGNRSTRRKPTPAPLCPPQNPIDTQYLYLRPLWLKESLTEHGENYIPKDYESLTSNNVSCCCPWCQPMNFLQIHFIATWRQHSFDEMLWFPTLGDVPVLEYFSLTQYIHVYIYTY